MNKNYTEYDLDIWMEPFWKGTTMYNESVSLIGLEDKAKLLYPPLKIIGVYDHTLTKEYKEGVDFKIDSKGYISLLENTSFPYMSVEEYYTGDFVKTKINGEIKDIHYGEDFYKTQLFITYEHKEDYDGFTPQSQKERFSKLRAKLEHGEDVTIFFFGDSITNGCNCSEMFNEPPYTHPWPMMFVEYIAKRYGYTIDFINPGLDGTYVPRKETISYGKNGKITYINTAVGGWWSEHCFEKYNEYVKTFLDKYGCDLYVHGFSQNDGPKTKDELKEITKRYIEMLTSDFPNIELLLVSTMIPNPILENIPWDCNNHQPEFEDAFIELSDYLTSIGISTGVAKLTSVSKSFLKTKRYYDVTGNNINHPNDFFIRAYAQTLFETVIGY